MLRFFSDTGRALWKAPSLWFRHFAAVASQQCPGCREARAEGRRKGSGCQQGHPCNWAPAAPSDAEHPLPRARGSRYSAAGRCRGGPGCSNAPHVGPGGIAPACRPSRGHGEGQRQRPASFQHLFSPTDEKSQRGPKQNSSEALVGTAELLTQS